MDKVVIGMSGGVDSSVAAKLLLDKGYDIYGVTLKTWNDSDTNLVASGDKLISDAISVANFLGIHHDIIDVSTDFAKYVIDYFCESYRSGITPNPCIVCNKKIKWNYLTNYADKLGIKLVATGHYANIIKLDNGRYSINRNNSSKDQSYALYCLSQEDLSRTIFPLVDYSKDEIRKIASDNNIPVATKSDSQDICFIPDHDYVSYVENRLKTKFKEGNFIDINGNVIGQHKGIINYTVGQRKGLNLALGKPCFVKEINPDTNDITVGSIDDIMSTEVMIDNVNYMGTTEFEPDKNYFVKIRYNHKGDLAKVSKVNNQLRIVYNNPQKGIAKGQSAVIYDNDNVMAGGVIV